MKAMPEELQVLYAHEPRHEKHLQQAYEEAGLEREADTFVLYRIIGNDLYPRHAKGQSRQNVRFILENEPELADCEKRWVLNRIFDAGERQAIIELLEQHGQSYLEIPFEAEAFAQIGWDYSAYAEPGFLSSAAFQKLGREQQERVLTAAYRKKNLYLMNNNGARNAALEDGRGRAKWVLPWDGNCFVTPSAWEAIRSAVRTAPHLPYFAVPMQRITDNAELLRDNFTPSPVEEPQLLFRRDARERFGENHPYGRRPKVELFWRLGIPGKWDRWKDDPWDQPRAEASPDAGAWGVAGWVARLASGKAHLEASTTESFKNRGLERQKAIRAAINHVTREVSAQPDPIGLTSYRLEAIEALRAKYQGKGESGGRRAGLLQTLLQNAAEALDRQPESPVDKPEPGPSGDLQDYYHPAPYWWPNPDTKDGLPYVRRDGERVPGTRMYEPESHRYDRTRLQRLFDDTTTLALAAFVTGNQRYTNHSVRWLERWFIDPATRMNPHLTYAQVRWGRNGNRGAQTGIIEMKDLYYALDAVRLLHHVGALSSDQMERLRAWFREYLDWLLTSEQGTKEAQARNNHGTYYDLQVAAIAAFLDDYDTLYATLARAEERIPLQISSTGIQYEEMTRTITAHYCCFTLQGWLNLLNLAARYDGSFVARAAQPDHPLRKAVEWLLAHEGFPWPYPQIDDFDHRRFLPVKSIGKDLRLISASFGRNGFCTPACFPPHDGVEPYWCLASTSVGSVVEPLGHNSHGASEHCHDTRADQQTGKLKLIVDRVGVLSNPVSSNRVGLSRKYDPYELKDSTARSVGLFTIGFGAHKVGAFSLAAKALMDNEFGDHSESRVYLITDDPEYFSSLFSLSGRITIIKITNGLRKYIRNIQEKRPRIGDNFFNTIYKYVVFFDWGHEKNIWVDSDTTMLGGLEMLRSFSNSHASFTPRMVPVDTTKGGSFYVTVSTDETETPLNHRDVMEVGGSAMHEGVLVASHRVRRVNTGVFSIPQSLASSDLFKRMFIFSLTEKPGKDGAKRQSDQNDINLAIRDGLFGESVQVMPFVYNFNVGQVGKARGDYVSDISSLNIILHYPGESKPWDFEEALIKKRTKDDQKGTFYWASREVWWEQYNAIKRSVENKREAESGIKRRPIVDLESILREHVDQALRESDALQVVGRSKNDQPLTQNFVQLQSAVSRMPRLEKASRMKRIQGRGGIQLFVNPEDPRLELMERREGKGQGVVYKIWDWAAREGLSNLFLDIGANYGEIALGASYEDDVTVALFEANPDLAEYLKASMGAHPSPSRFDLLMLALGEDNGSVQFALSQRSSGTSSLVFDSRMLDKGAYKLLEVPMVRLDDLPLAAMASANSAVLKVDVEGAELSVLKGGGDWLASLESYLAIVELNPKAMLRACGSLQKFVEEIKGYGNLYELKGDRVVVFDERAFFDKNKNKDVFLVKGTQWRQRLEAARV